MRKNLILSVLWISALLFASQVQATEKAAFFMGLGGLSGGGYTSTAADVSADGSVVVGQSTSASGYEAFRWSQGTGMVGLGYLPGKSFHSYATGVSADGSVVVGVNAGFPKEAFRWTQTTGMQFLGTLPGGNSMSNAADVSADGSIVVGMSASESGDEAYRWTEATGMVGLGDLPEWDFRSYAYGISADGSVVVGASSFPSLAFRWTEAAGMVGLGDLPGGIDYGWALNASADGSVVVGWSSSEYIAEAFRWTQASGMEVVDVMPNWCVASHANDVSADGSVIVGDIYCNGDRAFIWDEKNGLEFFNAVLKNTYGLDLTGWSLERATAISSDGKTIVGNGINPDGDEEAWITYLGPTCNLDSRFGQTDLSEGMTYYTDRNYTLTSVPATYVDMRIFFTPNEDRNLTDDSDYLTFTMPYDGTVYVAYDSRATSRPDWLNGFEYTGNMLKTSLSSQPSLKIYSQAYEQWDCVNLGANKARGFSGSKISNYIVFYGPDSDPGNNDPESCTYDITPKDQDFLDDGGNGTISVIAKYGNCSWTAFPTVDWITITSDDSGIGDGKIAYSVAANTTSSSRSGIINIEGKSHQIYQGPESGMHRLTVRFAGNGSGTVSHMGEECLFYLHGSKEGCVYEYPYGTVVDLQAIPGSRSYFDGWSGGGCGESSPCTVTMDQDLTLTATFIWPGDPNSRPPVISGISKEVLNRNAECNANGPGKTFDGVYAQIEFFYDDPNGDAAPGDGAYVTVNGQDWPWKKNWAELVYGDGFHGRVKISICTDWMSPDIALTDGAGNTSKEASVYLGENP